MFFTVFEWIIKSILKEKLIGIKFNVDCNESNYMNLMKIF